MTDADFVAAEKYHAASEVVAAKSYHNEAAAAPPWFHAAVQAALAPMRADLNFMKSTYH